MNENMQQPNMSADKSAAALAFATMLSEQMMPKMAPKEETLEMGEETPEAPQEPETAPVEEEVPEQEETPVAEEPVKEEPTKEENKDMENLTKDFGEFKGKIEGIIETKFNDLTQTLKDALK